MASGPSKHSGSVAIVVSRYNLNITNKLLEGAKRVLLQHFDESQIHVAWVPGAWELPIVVQALTSQPNLLGAVALGVVIKGETTHDQHINRAVSQALMDISLQSRKPIGFGLLTVNSLDQALHRAGGNVGNKGEEAAQALLDTLDALAGVRREA